MRMDRLNQWPLTRPLIEAGLVYETCVMRTAEPGGVALTMSQFNHMTGR
jgi:hypothetical protein